MLDPDLAGVIAKTFFPPESNQSIKRWDNLSGVFLTLSW